LSFRKALVAVAAAALLAAGCETQPRPIVIDLPPSPVERAPAVAAATPTYQPALLAPPAPAPEATPVGWSVRNRAIRCTVHGNGGETVLVLGGIHGNEPASATLARELCDRLARRPGLVGSRRVVIAPAVNPDGLAANTRHNARGVDLNRNFETANWNGASPHGPSPLSEPESRYIAGLVRRYHPARIVSIHQPLNCVDYDGPGLELAEAMSQACGLPVRKLGCRAGSLGSFTGEDLGIPTITLELPGDATHVSGETLWRQYGRAMLAAIRFSPGRAAK
jgi:protein MpaA